MKKRWMAVPAAMLAAAVLAGCVQTPEEHVILLTPTAGPTDSPAHPTDDTQPAPEFFAGGSASRNQAYFDYVNAQHQAGNGMSSGEAIVNNLASAGFQKSAMEVTYNQTAIGLKADSILVSVRIGDDCLIGQFSAGSYVGVREPVLGSGTCLIGKTKPIDW